MLGKVWPDLFTHLLGDATTASACHRLVTFLGTQDGNERITLSLTPPHAYNAAPTLVADRDG